MKRTRKNGAPGYDLLNHIHYQCNNETINELICTMFNTWNVTYHIPYYCRLGSIVPILKNTNGNTPIDYRPITLLPVLFKVYEKLILKNLCHNHKFRSKLHKLQGGNRAKRGFLP